MFFSPRCWKTEPDCKTGNPSHLNIFLSHLIPLESTNPDRKTKYEAELSQKPWKSDVSWAIWGFTLGSIPDRSSHALVSLLLNFMICIEFIDVLKCVRDQNMNNADPAGDLKRRHVTTIQRAWRCCNWNHWVNVCSPRTENTRPYGLSGYYNSRSWTSHQKILWLKQRADCLAIERHYANKSFNTSPVIVPVQRCFFNHPSPDKGRDGRRQRKINSRKTGRA